MRRFLLILATLAALPLSAATRYTIAWFPGPKWLLGRPLIYVPLTRGPQRSIRKVVVTPSEEPSVAMAGFPTHKYVVKVSFTIRESMYRSPVEEKFGATIEIWTTNAIDAALAMRSFDLTTGIAEVDALLVPALAKVSGFPLKTALSATRMFTGGQPETCVITATVSDVRTVAAPPHAFDRPPLLGAAGKN